MHILQIGSKKFDAKSHFIFSATCYCKIAK
jgi:hypothetical protein